MVNNQKELLLLQVKLLQLEHEQEVAAAIAEEKKRKLAQKNKEQADLLLRTIKMQLARTI